MGSFFFVQFLLEFQVPHILIRVKVGLPGKILLSGHRRVMQPFSAEAANFESYLPIQHSKQVSIIHQFLLTSLSEIGSVSS